MSIRERLLDTLTGLALIGGIVTAVIVIRREVVSRGPAPTATGEPRKVENWKQYIGTGRLVGPASAPLKLVEFADFQCPACKMFHTLFQTLRSDYPNDVAISYHYAPLSYHKMAYPAARAAECAAEQGQFGRYHDLLFVRFDSLRFEAFHEIAREAGVPNLAQFDTCNARTDSIPRINADRALAFDTLHIQGTPTMLVNGRMYAFAPPVSELKSMIEEARSSVSKR